MKLAASIANRETPVDGSVLGIALGDIGMEASSQSGFIGYAAGKTGARQNGELRFGHVEPTAVFRGVVKFQLPGDGASLLGRERLVERSRLVRIEVVRHDTYDVDVRIHLDDMLHGLGKLDLGAPLGDQYLAQPKLGLADHHQIAYPIAFVFDVEALGATRCRRDA